MSIYLSLGIPVSTHTMRTDDHISVYREAELVPLASSTVQLMPTGEARFGVNAAEVFAAGINTWMVLHV